MYVMLFCCCLSVCVRCHLAKINQAGVPEAFFQMTFFGVYAVHNLWNS